MLDAVIVGAGVSGLATARMLVASGLAIRVLEARDRVGGRLLSKPVDGTRIDLGASWFWPNEPRINRLIDDLSIATFPQYLAGDSLYHDPLGSRRLDGNRLDVPSGRFLHGAANVTDALTAELPADVVRLHSPVQVIDHRPVRSGGGHLTVRSGSETITARHVVVALPPALAVHAIEFRPGLPIPLAGLAAMTPVWMGGITKVVVRYASPFWRDMGLAGAAISHYGPMREIHDLSGPDGSPAALFGFASGPPGSPTVTETEVLDQLHDLFGAAARNPIGVLIHDWRMERFTSPPGIGELTAFRTFGHERYTHAALDGRLHWSSTETAQEAPGHIEGALQAAERSAAAIVASS